MKLLRNYLKSTNGLLNFMEKFDRTTSVNNDPRFLHLLTFEEVNNDQNLKFNTLKDRLNYGRHILKNTDYDLIEPNINYFTQNFIPIIKFDSLVHSDPVTRYFIYILIRMIYQSDWMTFISFKFNFEDLYIHKDIDTDQIDVEFKKLPIINLDSKYKKEENIVYINNIFLYYGLNIYKQEEFIKKLNLFNKRF